MKQIKKLKTKTIKALGSDGKKVGYFPVKVYPTEKEMFDKINELVDAFNYLNKTTRKIIFVDDENE